MSVVSVPPASDANQRPPPGGVRWIRTGAAPRPASSPDHRALHATSAAPCHPEPRPFEQLSRPRTASASPSSKGAASATRSGFAGRLLLSISFRRLRGGSSRPLQSPRLPSTKPRTSRFPARPAGGLPPAQRIRAAATPGSRGRRGPLGSPAPPRRSCRREAFPRTRAARAPPVTSPHPPPAGAAGQGRRTRLRRTLSRPPRQGCFTRPPATRDEIRAPEVPFIEKLPQGGSGSPQVVSNLWIPDTMPLLSSRSRSQGHAHDVVMTRP
jgi:hypothetical protein